MLGSAYYLLGAIALVVLQPSAALNSTTANAVCNLLQDGTLIYSGLACGEYYSCSSGVATLTACASGYDFSTDNQGCVPSSSSTCGTTDTNPCANADNGEFLAVADSCSGYYYCSNGAATRGNCPDGLNFDPIQQSCNYTSDYACASANDDGDPTLSINLCAYIQSGIYFASSASCQAWQTCKSGVLSIGNCASPYYFNVLTGDCDYEDNVSCRQLDSDTTIGNSAGYLAGTACSTNGLIVSDNQTCVGYYICSNLIYTYGTCSNGLYYNPPTRSCVDRLNAVNNCNRCEGTTLEFVNLYQDNCEGYGYCLNGRMMSTGNCSSGYFDEVAEACVIETEEPQYPVCNDSLSGLSTTTSSSTSTDSSSSNSTSSGSTSSGSTSSDSTSSGSTSSDSTSSDSTSSVSSSATNSTVSTVETTVSTVETTVSTVETTVSTSNSTSDSTTDSTSVSTS